MRDEPPHPDLAPIPAVRETVHDYLTRRGYTRRQFLELAGAVAALLGYRTSPLAASAGRAIGGDPATRLAWEVARALQTAPRAPLIWLQLQDCAGCTSALTRTRRPTMVSLILDALSIEYHETLSAAAGEQIEANKQTVMEERFGEYLLVVEGSIPADGAYCAVGGRPARAIVEEAAAGARGIIATGNCAAFGGLPAAAPNPTAALSAPSVLAGRQVINVPGCPAIPEVTAGVIAHIVVEGQPPELDDLGRPLPYYAQTVHDACERRRHFRDGEFAASFDDEGARQGWCLFELGCRGPETFNSCATMGWLDGLSYPVASGHPCLGCSEPGFWDKGSFYPWEPRPRQIFVPRVAKGQ
ncbi:MAG: hydrogenase small subunit [Anaerolineae bacterium]